LFQFGRIFGGQKSFKIKCNGINPQGTIENLPLIFIHFFQVLWIISKVLRLPKWKNRFSPFSHFIYLGGKLFS